MTKTNKQLLEEWEKATPGAHRLMFWEEINPMIEALKEAVPILKCAAGVNNESGEREASKLDAIDWLKKNGFEE